MRPPDVSSASKMGASAGALAPLKALGFLLRHPRLWGLAAAPFLINLGLFALFFWFSYTRFQGWVESLVPTGEGWWWAVLFYFLVILAVLLLLALEVLLFSVVGRIIAAPFLELLTRGAERLALGQEVKGDWAETSIWQDMLRVLGQELKKLALFVLAMVVLLAVNLIPGLGLAIYPVLSFILTAFFLALEFLDYPLDRRGLTLPQKIGYVRRMGLRGWLGFGSAVFALGVVPVLNLALLPLAAVGGTLLYLKKPL